MFTYRRCIDKWSFLVMGWNISISAEGWNDIHNDLETWSKEDLVGAVAFDPSIKEGNGPR
jgi:hypothetical protein